MAAQTGFPKWMLDAKDKISRSKDWDVFVEELYDAVQQQLKESHVQAFTDLTAPERQLFMERAAKAIHGGKAYGDLYDKVSECLDRDLNNEVSRQLLEDYPINTKTDLILDAAQEGAVSLLKRWPDMKTKLHLCFNQPLPKSLRQLAWKLFLENTKVRKKYVDLLTHNPRAAISKMDFEISQKCEQLLLTEPTVSDLKGSIGAFYGMKAVLSFYHSSSKSTTGLADVDFLLVVPFVMVASSNMSRREPASNHIVALMVEEYFTLIHSRPGYVLDSGSQAHDDQLMSFCRKVASWIQHKSPGTAEAISDVFLPSKAKTPESRAGFQANNNPGNDPGQANKPGISNTNNNNNEVAAGERENRETDKIVATETGAHALLSEALVSLVRPIIRSLFVGYVNMDVLLFIWDQYIIGLDAPGFHDEYLPAVTSIFFMLLRDKITKCNSPPVLEMALRNEGVNLKVPQFQYELKRHFAKDLMKLLNHDDRAALPVLDPTQANYRPWVYWFSDNIPSRITPQDRRRARDERAAERERLLQQQRDEEARRRAEADKQRYEDEKRLLEQQAIDRQRQADDRLYLEDQLDAERRKRMEMERKADSEIEELKREIEELRRKQMKSSASMHSLESTISRYLIPPPPTAANSTYREMTPIEEVKLKTPEPSRPASSQVDDVLTDLLTRVSQGFNKVSHGDASDRRALDQETQEHIQQHKEDVKEAEVEVFGHNLKPGEFEQMSSHEQKRTSDLIMEVIRRKLQERREHQHDTAR